MKLFGEVIRHRLNEKPDEDMTAAQFGLRKFIGKRKLQYAHNMLRQQCLDVNQNTVSFIDCYKAIIGENMKKKMKM